MPKQKLTVNESNNEVKDKGTQNKPKSSAYYQRQYRQRLREQGLVKKEVWVLPDHNQLLLKIEKALRLHQTQMLEKLAQINVFSPMQDTDKPELLPFDSTNQINNTLDTTKNSATQTKPKIKHNSGEDAIGGSMQTSLQLANQINNHKATIADEFPNLKNIQWTTETLFQTLKKAPMFINGLASIELIEGVHATIYICMHEFGDLPMFLNVTGEQLLVESLLFSADEVVDKVRFNELVLRTHKYFPLSTISLDNIGEDGEYYQMFGALSSTSSLQEVLIEIELLAHNVMQATEAYSAFFKTQQIAS